jgi:hypothetical protein
LPLTLREEHRLRVFENRVLRRIFAPKEQEVTKVWRKCIMNIFTICILHLKLIGQSRDGA